MSLSREGGTMPAERQAAADVCRIGGEEMGELRQRTQAVSSKLKTVATPAYCRLPAAVEQPRGGAGRPGWPGGPGPAAGPPNIRPVPLPPAAIRDLPPPPPGPAAAAAAAGGRAGLPPPPPSASSSAAAAAAAAAAAPAGEQKPLSQAAEQRLKAQSRIQVLRPACHALGRPAGGGADGAAPSRPWRRSL